MDTTSDITKYAALLFTVDEIAFVCGIDARAFRTQIRAQSGEYYAAYMRGRLATKEMLNKQMLEMAAAGSPQAEAAILENLDNQKRNE